MKYYAQLSKEDLNKMSGPFVALSKSGIPTIIPVHHRHVIAQRNERSDKLVRLYLSWFSLCRIIRLAKPVSKATFESIVTPVQDIDRVKQIHQMIKERFSVLQKLYLPWISTIPLQKGFSWIPTWKSTPNDDRQFSGHKAVPNIFTSVKYEIAAFARDLRLIHSWEGVFSPSILFRGGSILYPLDYKYNTQVANQDLDFYEKNPGIVFDNLASAFESYPLRSGKIAQSLEGAGKRRLFVIGNYFKQRLLHPVHERAMTVLRRLPTDGTFYQDRPIHRLIARPLEHCSSFDLSSATDRWPVSTIHELVACIFGPTLASCIVNGGLALNSCYVGPPMVRKPTHICFVAGQPLGYYGSWALFALTHHYMVWLAADRVAPRRMKPFLHYALLGDDIVIADEHVAREYRALLGELQVKISEAKSLVSPHGALEFAKQFWVTRNGQSINLSPVSAKAVLAANSHIQYQQLAKRYNLSVKTVVRLAGGGYRVLGRLNSPTLTRRWKRILALSHKLLVGSSELPLDFWIGRGNPISPYLKGILVQRVREAHKLKQLVLPPKEMWWSEGEQDNAEYTTVRNWMVVWLRYLKWYSLIHLDPNPSLLDLFSPPVVSYTYRRVIVETLQPMRMWSFLYKMYDLAEGRSTPGWTPPPLTANWPALGEGSGGTTSNSTDSKPLPHIPNVVE